VLSNEPTLIIVRCPKPPPSPYGGSKTQNGRFRGKIALRLKKVCYKVSSCEKYQQQSCKAFIRLTIRAKMIGGEVTPSTWNFVSNWPRWSEIADFRSIFARSASAVTPSKKVKFSACFPMSPRWTSYVVPEPQGGRGLENALSKISTISCDNSETIRCIGPQLLLITNRKSHTGFRLVPTSITLNDLERRNSPSLRFRWIR